MPRIARASGRRGRARGQHGRGRDIPALELPEQLVTTSETLQTEARNRNGDAVQSMAPNPQQILEGNLRNTIHTLFTIQSNTHGYLGNETQRALVQNFQELSSNLQGVASSAQKIDKLLPPELLAYIDEGRNPDIYTREFVELVQKGNRYLKGKSQALEDFKDELAKQMVEEWPEMKDSVQRVLDGKGVGMEGMEGMAGGGNNAKATTPSAATAS